ncbi:MAG TPA: hypothetical protein VNS58_00845 [Puia sp.]|nr:hypothetical protein [Puia sp.]
MQRKKIWLMVSFSLLLLVGLGQTPDVQRVIGPSPNVASLFKFNEQPISLYTGTPDIQIPLYTLTLGKIEMPIGLMYHASGIKVTENASWAGLGWTLNAGGAVASVVNGLSDWDVPAKKIMKDTLTKCDLTNILSGNYDSQKDLFYFNFLNQSGQFYLNDSNQVFQIPYTKIKIEGTHTNAAIPYAWKITNTDGSIFIFNQMETNYSSRQTILRSGGSNGGGTTLESQTNPAYTIIHPSVSSETWFLTKIISPTGDSVMLNYEIYSAVCQYFKGETNYYQQSGVQLTCGQTAQVVPINTSSYELQRITGWRLKSIVTRNGNVQFITGGNRCDLLGDRYLSEIDINDNTGSTVKKFLLKYDYLVGNALSDVSSVDCSGEALPQAPTVDFSLPSLQRRLMLMEVDQVNIKSSQIDNRYRLSYNIAPGLPTKFSSQQDTWGYFNGNGQGSLLQNLAQSPSSMASINVPIIKGRDPNLAFAEQGILTKITYPTGGSSSFVYELNSIRNEGSNCGPVYVIPDLTMNIAATSNNVLISTFTVNHCQGGDSVMFKITNCNFTTVFSSPTTLPYGFYVMNGSTTILSSNDVITKSNGNTSNGGKFYLPNGTYSIYSFSSSGPNCTYTVLIPGRNEPQFVSAVNNHEIVQGGLRIKQIVHTDSINNSMITKNYDYRVNANGINASSGFQSYPYSFPWTNSFLTARDLPCSTGGELPVESPVVALLNFNSNSNYPLTGTHGAVVGYAQVTESRVDNNGNDFGHTVYTFSTPVDSAFLNLSYGGDFYPFAPNYSNEWQRGLTLKKEDYKNIGSGKYSIVERKQNFFSAPKVMDATHSVVAAYYLNSQMPFSDTCTPNTGVWYNSYAVFKYTPYRLYSRYEVLDSTSTEAFDDSAHEVKLTTHYYYNSKNLLPDTTITTNSKNETVLTSIKYPLDYTFSGSATIPIAQGIQNLQTNYVINPEIERFIQRSNSDGSNKRTIASVLATYKTGAPSPDVIYNWEPTVGTTSFSPTVMSISSVTMDPGYQPKIYFDSYDSYGNILQQHKYSNGILSYIWGYDTTYPIAEVKNASLSDIAHTSFESDGTGNWNSFTGTVTAVTSAPYPPTGSKYYNLTTAATLNKSGLGIGQNYIISYWSRNGAYSISGGNAVGSYLTGKLINGWTYYEHTINATSATLSISGTGAIDEVRLYPAGALMTTYTYKPLIGISSECDADNRVSYYEYDGAGRLKWIKDQDGNIIKTFNYHYKGEVIQ